MQTELTAEQKDVIWAGLLLLKDAVLKGAVPDDVHQIATGDGERGLPAEEVIEELCTLIDDEHVAVETW